MVSISWRRTIGSSDALHIGFKACSRLAQGLARHPDWDKMPGFSYAPAEWHGIGDNQPVVMRIEGEREQARFEIKYNAGYASPMIDEAAALRLIPGILKKHELVSDSTARELSGNINSQMNVVGLTSSPSRAVAPPKSANS